jgi:hypothetical protein
MDMDTEEPQKRGKKMEFLIPLGVLVVWVILQALIFPRMGVRS